MKRFEYESTMSQLEDVLEYSRSPDISTASKIELELFLIVLRRHFNEILPGHNRYQSYQGAVQHIESLIALKQSEKPWYEKLIGKIVVGLFIAVVGGFLLIIISKYANAIT